MPIGLSSLRRLFDSLANEAFRPANGRAVAVVFAGQFNLFRFMGRSFSGGRGVRWSGFVNDQALDCFEGFSRSW